MANRPAARTRQPVGITPSSIWPPSAARPEVVARRGGAVAVETKAELEYARYHALIDGLPGAIDAELENVATLRKKPAAPRGKKERNT